MKAIKYKKGDLLRNIHPSSNSKLYVIFIKVIDPEFIDGEGYTFEGFCISTDEYKNDKGKLVEYWDPYDGRSPWEIVA